MKNIVEVSYAQTGKSAQHDKLGMREMQGLAYLERSMQYLLIKAPPASGKSRALMFLILDKLKKQGLRKAIVAVPEMSIAGSFKNTPLIQHGFFADWIIKPENNLCVAGGESGKVDAFIRFMLSDDKILVCTHATLRYAFDKIDPELFNDCVIGIDEFHHVSAKDNNRLGALVDSLIQDTNAHIIAMTGSYFRGDAVPILMPEDEALFTKVTYTYYEQLNGYRYLKSLGIGYHFYQGRYNEALPDVLDSDKKTIIYIPNVNSAESSGDKFGEYDLILDVIGEVQYQDPNTGIYHIKRKSDGKLLKVANLVDDSSDRVKVQAYLRDIKAADDMDIIVALGMAKEGFDWPFCEHVLTIGYRSSMTEIVQIIGRATRDCPGKTHAQFTYLIAQPDATDEDVKVSVNTMLKAIMASLLMEQILAPNIRFKPRSQWNGKELPPNTVLIDDIDAPVSNRTLSVLNGGTKEEIMAELMNDARVTHSVAEATPPDVITQIVLPQIIKKLYPELKEKEIEQVRVQTLRNIIIGKHGGLLKKEDLPFDAVIEKKEGKEPLNNAFINMGDRFVNIDDLPLDLINAVNPFHKGIEVLSDPVTAALLKTVQEVIRANRSTMTVEEAAMLWPRIKDFLNENQRHPSLNSSDAIEVRYAEALAFLKKEKQKQQQER